MDPILKFDVFNNLLQVIYNKDQIKIEEIKNKVNCYYIFYIIFIKKNMLMILDR